MPTPTKLFSIIIFSLIIGNSAIIAMEKESQITEKPEHRLMLYKTSEKSYRGFAFYGTKGYHNHHCIPYNLPSTINDPLIRCIIKSENTFPYKRECLIAAKYLLTVGEIKPNLKLTFNDDNEKDLNILVRCKRNKNLNRYVFVQQVKDAMESLYTTPEKHLCVYTEQPNDLLFSPDSINDFIAAGILEKNEKGCARGPKAYCNEEALLKSIQEIK